MALTGLSAFPGKASAFHLEGKASGCLKESRLPSNRHNKIENEGDP